MVRPQAVKSLSMRLDLLPFGRVDDSTLEEGDREHGFVQGGRERKTNGETGMREDGDALNERLGEKPVNSRIFPVISRRYDRT